ncbi:MAG: hypothetical protein M3277_07380 [Actinomycetota bacterium]|nr:hypothetical protein [Actinomycetota bacterium]
MTQKLKGESFRRSRSVALLVVGILVGALLVTPVTAHVGGWAHNWKKHIRPKADTRYVRPLTAFVNSSGFLARGTGATSSSKVDSGVYEVVFDRDIPGQCVFQATIVANQADETSDNGQIAVSPRFTADEPVTVRTYGADGAAEDRGFWLALIC